MNLFLKKEKYETNNKTTANWYAKEPTRNFAN